MYDIEILDTCIRCGACVETCPARVFVQNEDVRAAYPAGCILCGHCVAVCPVDAVAHHGFDGCEFPLISPGASVNADDLVPFLRSRRSVREFRDKPVPREVLENLLDAARYAATASNAQTVRYVVIADPERRGALSERIMRWFGLAGRLGRLPGVLSLGGRIWGRARLETYLDSLGRMLEVARQGGDPIFHGAPALIITHGRKGDMLAVENNAYATYQMAMTAHAMGLGTCMIGFLTAVARYDPRTRRMAGVPKGHRLTTALIVGYPRYRYRRLVPRNPPRARWIEAK